jgi:hypothetical protein
MKKNILFIISLFVYCASIAQIKGYISVYSEDGDKFWVIADGKKINNEPLYLVEKFPVETEWGYLKIIFEDPKKGEIKKRYQVVDVDGNHYFIKYKITKNKKGKYEIRDINSTFDIINLNTAQQTNQTVQPQTNPNQNPQQTTNPPQNTNVNVGVNVNQTPTGVQDQMQIPEFQTPEGVITHTQTSTSLSMTQQVNNPNPQQVTMLPQPTQALSPSNCLKPMDANEFLTAKQSIASKSFEDSKLTLAKQIASSNCLLSSQVKEIMQLFSFEDSRIEFAKYAYKYTYDKKNYYQINDAFKFESSIDELNEYLKTNP